MNESSIRLQPWIVANQDCIQIVGRKLFESVAVLVLKTSIPNKVILWPEMGNGVTNYFWFTHKMEKEKAIIIFPRITKYWKEIRRLSEL